jgi:SAM-dependent methyltransferase
MSHSVRSHLRLDIEAYDGSIRRFIPGYEEMLAAAADAVASTLPGHVLDLGAGTGALSAEVLERTASPGGSGGAATPTVVELIDIDAEMLGQSQLRLRDFGARAKHTLLSFDEQLPACDAAMASLSLHHIPTLEAKGDLFRRVHDALSAGGVFVNADITMPTTTEERRATYEEWAEHLVANGIRRADAFAHFAAWADQDRYFPLEDELTAIRSAGFRAECVWRQGVSTVVTAYSQMTP